MLKKYFYLIHFFIFLCFFNAYASPTANQTARYFESIKTQPEKLHQFLKTIPKGGDLHNHESGATYAENLLRYAAQDNLCVDRNTFIISKNTACLSNNLLQTAVQDVSFKDALIDAWSMRHFIAGKETGHDHFFATFEKFGLISNLHRGEIIAEISERVASQNGMYVELMVTADNDASGVLGKQLGFNADLTVLRQQLLNANLNQIVQQISDSLTEDENTRQKILLCNTALAKKGCDVTVRYLYQVLREQPPEMVFAQLLAGFEAASKDKRIVGINMVQPEDGIISMRDYTLHMRMVAFLHTLYPTVKISLHAGELTSALVSDAGLKFHITQAVMLAHANRIGHGVDVLNENNADALLKYLASHHILVEINLTSNEEILNVSGRAHPFASYLQYGVPLALSTDDEGVSRGNLTKEFEKAVSIYHVSYDTLKNMVRNSIEYAFLSGDSLWQDAEYQTPNAACAKDIIGNSSPSTICQVFLNTNEKASVQWQLEQRFLQFENQYAK